MVTIDPSKVSVVQVQAYLQGAVTPRPIAFASTIDKHGAVNLSPFSFFNCFGMNPPLLVFSPSRRVRDNSTKHTYQNVLEVPEVVINIVNYAMVQQTSLTSTEYGKGVDEFIKGGFTPAPSLRVKPPRVVESPVSMECRVLQTIPTGTEGGAGNLVLCEVLMIHLQEYVLDGNGRIDPYKLDAVGRLGADWYCRIQGDSIFKVPKPLDKLGVGVDAIPQSIRQSKILSGNDLGLLGNVESLPSAESIQEFRNQHPINEIILAGPDAVHQFAHHLLAEGNAADAWKILLGAL